MNPTSRYKINAPHIVHEIFADNEAAIINLKTGNYYSLDAVGAFVWAHIEAGATAGQIVDEVFAQYVGDRAEVNNEIGKFLDMLCAEQLIVTAIENPSSGGAQPGKAAVDGKGAKAPFTPPMLEHYNDMQELLLLDPIHEVDETGWPHRKQED